MDFVRWQSQMGDEARFMNYIIKLVGCDSKNIYLLGMSFVVRFRVRAFGNKHPDGSNVRIFFFFFFWNNEGNKRIISSNCSFCCISELF